MEKSVRNKKSTTFVTLLVSISIFLPACANGANSVSSSIYFDDSFQVGSKLVTANNISFNDEESVFDGFSNGVDYDRWTIGNGAWGNGNGGVVPANVSYTDDGVLVLQGNGLYYSKGDIKGVGTLKDGRNTGGVLISKFKTKPGRYQVSMKVLPRLGACTAFWTYANRSTESGVNDNHEIDIELPGGKTTSVISFQNVLNTNYTTESYSISQDANLQSVNGSDAPICLNDGQFHQFGFDWYTDPEVVVYYVDNVVTAIAREFVPTLETRVWLGNWFPNNSGFVGQSLFETDYMYVDYFLYRPFKDQPYVEHDAAVTVSSASRSDYPTTPVSYPSVDKVANGDFEYLSDHGQSDYGWTYGVIGDKETADDYSRGGLYGRYSSYGAEIGGKGYLTQIVDSVYDGYEFDLSMDAKGSSGYALVSYLGSYSGDVISTVQVDFDSSDWKTYQKSLVAPKGTYSMMIDVFSAAKSQVAVDNVSLIRK